MALTNEEIIEALKEMPLLQASEIVKAIEEEFGVSAAAPVAVAAVGGAAGGDAAGLGLKEAKEAVEGVPTPIAEGVNQEKADEIKAKLEEAGAAVTLK